MNKYINTVLIMFILNCTFLHAISDKGLYKFNYRNGLQSKHTFFGLQSQNTSLFWFASDNGLVNYDGTSFNDFEYLNPFFGIPTIKLIEDNDGQIWFYTSLNNICYFNGNKFIVPNFKAETKNKLNTTKILDLWICNNQEILILTKSLVRDSFYLFNIKKDINSNYKLYDVTHLINNNITKGISYYKYFNEELFCKALISNKIFYKVHGISDDIYHSNDSIIRVKNKEKIETIFSLKVGMITNVQIINSSIYISTTGGAYKVKSNLVSKLLDNEINISSIFYDRDSNLFFTTINEGILVKPSVEIEELKIRSQHGFTQIKVNNDCLLFSDSKYNLGFYNMINEKTTFIINDEQRYSDNGIFIDRQKVFYNKQTIEFVKNKTKVKSINYIPFQKVNFFKDTFLVTTGYADVKIIDSKNNTKYTVYYGERVFDAKIDAGNNLWIATKNHLFRYRIQSFEDWKIVRKDTIIKGFQIEKIKFLNDKVYFILNKKFLCYIHNNIVYKDILSSSIISNRVIQDYMYIDDKLIVCTNYGLYLCLVDKAKPNTISSARLISYIDGLFPDQVVGIDTFKGKLYFASSNNVFRVDISKIKLKAFYTCILNSISTNKRFIGFSQSKIIEKLVFENDENSIEFRMVNSYLFKPNKVSQYKYQLIFNGKQLLKNYSNSDNLRFENLKYGKYTLVINSRNINNEWSIPKIIKFDVKPKFIETNWFVLLIFLSITLIFVFVIFKYINLKNEKIQFENLKLENENYQLQLLRSQLNPHFLFNALNSLKSLIYLNRYDTAVEYTDNLSGFLRSILETGIEHSVIISREIELVKSYFYIEGRRLGNKIELSIECPDELLIYKIPSNILQPIVENSIKYGLGTNIEKLLINIHVELSYGLLMIVVEDNSQKLIAPKIEGASFSLKSIQNRINLFNKNNIKNSLELIEIQENGTKLGVRVVVKLMALT